MESTKIFIELRALASLSQIGSSAQINDPMPYGNQEFPNQVPFFAITIKLILKTEQTTIHRSI
jgi:hypothetical protein